MARDFENNPAYPYEMTEAGGGGPGMYGGGYTGPKFSFRDFFKSPAKACGINQNRNLRTLTHQDLVKTFKESGFSLSNHAIKRLKDPRTQKLGFKTPNDIMKIFNKGERFDAGKGEVGFGYKKMEAIVNPKTKRIITFRPKKTKRD